MKHSPLSLRTSLLFSFFPRLKHATNDLPVCWSSFTTLNIVLWVHIPGSKSKHIKKPHISLITSSTSRFCSFHLLFWGKTTLRSGLRSGFENLMWKPCDSQKSSSLWGRRYNTLYECSQESFVFCTPNSSFYPSL